MLKFSNFLKLFLIVAFVLVAWYGYPIVKDRYFKNVPTETTNDSSSIESEDLDNKDSDLDEEESEEILAEDDNVEDQEETSIDEQATLKKEGKIYLEITSENCDSECDEFSGDDLEYCQETCGLVEPEENKENCDSLSGLQKDYCLKDLGIQNKDFSYCEEISDKNIAETCNNRILEDILEENSSLEN